LNKYQALWFVERKREKCVDMNTNKFYKRHPRRDLEGEIDWRIPTRKLTFWHPTDMEYKMKSRSNMIRNKKPNKKKRGQVYETLTLREIVGLLRKHSQSKNEPLTKEKLGKVTLRNIVEVAQKYAKDDDIWWKHEKR